MRVGGHPVPDQLGEYRCVALAGVFEIFEHQNAGAFADDEPVPALVPWAARAFGRIVSRRQGAHGGKAGNTQRRDGRFRAAADPRVSLTLPDPPETLPDRMR